MLHTRFGDEILLRTGQTRASTGPAVFLLLLWGKINTEIHPTIKCL